MTNKKRRNWKEREKGGKNRAKRSRREEEGGETDWTGEEDKLESVK